MLRVRCRDLDDRAALGLGGCGPPRQGDAAGRDALRARAGHERRSPRRPPLFAAYLKSARASCSGAPRGAVGLASLPGPQRLDGNVAALPPRSRVMGPTLSWVRDRHGWKRATPRVAAAPAASRRQRGPTWREACRRAGGVIQRSIRATRGPRSLCLVRACRRPGPGSCARRMSFWAPNCVRPMPSTRVLSSADRQSTPRS